jgi:hypothetical protein
MPTEVSDPTWVDYFLQHMMVLLAFVAGAAMVIAFKGER